eukprot:CAMPEP_0180716088 /NCGR_PEP_ID=MMETSP1038_2-20121128/13277_1 /TAXON_ID=632150 /ORGANISM="Azadinium spinosum, Strain 3D9" /LENGTH=288 /DNA_ID=CAMNT_0022748513 /DNA_START=351 /DNA_END=1214 /DNA_ORIENTATION=-
MLVTTVAPAANRLHDPRVVGVGAIGYRGNTRRCNVLQGLVECLPGCLVGRPVGCPVERLIEWLVERLVQCPVERLMERPAQPRAERPVERRCGRPVECLAERPERMFGHWAKRPVESRIQRLVGPASVESRIQRPIESSSASWSSTISDEKSMKGLEESFAPVTQIASCNFLMAVLVFKMEGAESAEELATTSTNGSRPAFLNSSKVSARRGENNVSTVCLPIRILYLANSWKQSSCAQNGRGAIASAPPPRTTLNLAGVYRGMNFETGLRMLVRTSKSPSLDGSVIW